MLRTRESSKREYERAWSRLLARIEHEARAANADVCEIVDSVRLPEMWWQLSGKRFREMYEKVGIEVRRFRRPEQRLVVLEGKYAVVSFESSQDLIPAGIIADFISRYPNEIDCVVELGSGIGGNLFHIFDTLHAERRSRLEFHACEFTDAGREAARKLAGLEKGMNLSVHEFDYYHPEFPFLSGEKSVLFVTVHSIEQIPVLDSVVLEKMLDASSECCCIHAEPVGWQLLQEHAGRRGPSIEAGRTVSETAGFVERLSAICGRALRRIDSAAGRYGMGFLNEAPCFGIELASDDLGRPDKVNDNALKWSEAHGYNTNLIALLREFERRGRIAIEEERMNVCGANPFNPATIVRWRKVPENREPSVGEDSADGRASSRRRV